MAWLNTNVNILLKGNVARWVLYKGRIGKALSHLYRGVCLAIEKGILSKSRMVHTKKWSSASSEQVSPLYLPVPSHPHSFNCGLMNLASKGGVLKQTSLPCIQLPCSSLLQRHNLQIKLVIALYLYSVAIRMLSMIIFLMWQSIVGPLYSVG